MVRSGCGADRRRRLAVRPSGVRSVRCGRGGGFVRDDVASRRRQRRGVDRVWSARWSGGRLRLWNGARHCGGCRTHGDLASPQPPSSGRPDAHHDRGVFRTRRKADKSGTFRWYNHHRLPPHLGGGAITVRLHGNDEDTARKFNRTENVRPIHPATPTSPGSSSDASTPKASTAPVTTPPGSAEPVPSAKHDNASTC